MSERPRIERQPNQLASEATLAVTVVIPTFNGRRFLGIVLSAVGRQTLAGERFEVVVVDNNSTVDLFEPTETQAAVNSLRNRGVAFHCVREPRQGLTFARDCGVSAATAPAVCFLDDDNEPTPEYLAEGLAAIAYSSVGILVSRVLPVYAEPPSPAVRRREHLFGAELFLRR